MIMLPEKSQGSPTYYDTVENSGLSVGNWVDGPPSVYAETEGGVKYFYLSYALAIVTDETSANIALWRGVYETVSALLENAPLDAISDPVILWRERPSISKEDGAFRVYMRCVVVPRDETFLPAKPLTVGESITQK